MQSLPVRKKKNTGARAAPASNGKLEAATENYGSLFDFYQKQTLNAAYWFIFLQITTLVGAALTPIMLLVPFPPGDTHAKLWQALPAAIGALRPPAMPRSRFDRNGSKATRRSAHWRANINCSPSAHRPITAMTRPTLLKPFRSV